MKKKNEKIEKNKKEERIWEEQRRGSVKNKKILKEKLKVEIHRVQRNVSLE